MSDQHAPRQPDPGAGQPMDAPYSSQPLDGSATAAQAPAKRLRDRPWPYFVGALALVVLTIVVVAILAPILNRDNPNRAKAGDCVEEVGSDRVELIACDDPKADFRVVAKVENQAASDATVNACLRFQDQGVVSSFWEGERGGKGYVLCLAKVAG